MAAAAAIVFGVVLGPGRAGTSPLLARLRGPQLRARPGRRAGHRRRRHDPRHPPDLPGRRLRHAGPAAAPGWDRNTFGKPVTAPQQVRRPAGKQPLARARASRLGLAERRLRRPPDAGATHTDYAPFILRPSRLGTLAGARRRADQHVARVRRRQTATAGTSTRPSTRIDLTHPFAASRVNGKPVPAGLPEQFQRFDVGFLRWYWHSGYQADFISDDDLEHLSSARQLSRVPARRLRRPRGVRHLAHVRPDHRLPQRRRQPRVPVGEQLLLQGEGLGEHDDRPHPVARPRPARGGARRRAVRRLERGQLPEPAVPHHQHRRRAVAVRGHGPARRQRASATTGSRSTSRTPRRRRTRTSWP